MTSTETSRAQRLPQWIRSNRYRLAILGIILGLIGAGAGAAVLWPVAVPETIEIADDQLDELSAVNPGYLGIDACAACHAERVAEVRETNHSRTFRKPAADEMPAGFTAERGKFQTHDPSLRFEMSRSGNDFFQTSIRVTQGGEERKTSRVDFVLGAGGKADEVYLTWHGDRLFELPMAWLYTFDDWGCSHINPHGTGDFGRESTVRCMECHNTWFEHVAGTRNSYRPDSFIPGVTCENCHGPGREHVLQHTAQPQAQSGFAIVKPASLTRERKLEVCTQCHSNAIRHRGPPLSYRPGQPLDAHYRTVVGPAHTEDDHVANQIKYLRESRCFQGSAEMTCTTCHDPHRPDSREASGLRSCRKCHGEDDCRERPRLPEAVREDCAGCHMPRYIKINVNFETEDDNFVPPIRRTEHRIAVHPRAHQEVLLNWHRQQPDSQSRAEVQRLTRILVEDWLTEAEACRRDYRFMGAIAALREAYRIAPEPTTRDKIREVIEIKATRDRELANADVLATRQQYPKAIEILEGLLRIKPDDAAVHGKLGTSLAAIGQDKLAMEHWQAVAEHDSDDPYGYAMLGWNAFLQDRLEDSVEAYRQADEVDPFQARINYHWGLALSRMGRWSEADERFRHLLKIDPRHAGGLEGLAQALRHQERATEALSFARRAVHLTDSQNTGILLTLSEVYADIGRPAEAEEAAGRAMKRAESSDPKSLAQFRLRRDEAIARAKARRKQ